MNEFITQFKAIVQAYPEHIAICVDNTLAMTYATLELKALALSHKLVEHGIKAGHLVAINIEKSPEYIIAMLATWMTGAAFLPIDPSLPRSRQTFFLTQAKPNLIIDQSFHLDSYHVDTCYDAHLAYILFTSGSTGQPKGVLVPHAGIVNVLQQQIALFQIGPGDRALSYLSTQFDASISDMGTVLLSGATLCLLASYDKLKLARELPSVLNKYNISHIDIPPSLLAVLDSEQIYTSLKTIIIGGEVCPREVVHRWGRRVRLINVYGPTEATICTSMECCTTQWQHASIGTPIAHMEYHVLNEDLQPATEGELYISGIGLALGYLNNTALTQAKFITLDDKTHYRTGDRVKQDEHGHYIYLGRIDRQLKIRGQLIAPEEIEAALCQHPNVQRAAIIFDRADYPNQLIAIVEALGVSSNLLRYFLNTLLPSWMIPNQLIIVEKLPQNTNEKIDYDAIEKMPLPNAMACNVIVNDKIATQLQHICKEVLALSFLPSLHADLIHTLGATSLDMIKILVGAELQGLYLSTEIINHLPTIYDLSVWLQGDHFKATEAMHTNLLRKEIPQLKRLHPLPPSRTNHILLTGATGFLGIHLLEALLLNTNYPVTCLVRAKNNLEALNKIKQTAMKYHLNIEDALVRMRVVTGDVSLPQLGMTDDDWSRLSNEIAHIYHCAAEVNMIKPFAALKNTNLGGTTAIAAFALNKKHKKIYYMSSLSVFVATDQNTGICQENDRLEKTKYVYGGYAQSKWAAEYFLQQGTLDVSIFRLGLITGHSQTGHASDTDYLTMFIKGLEALKALPAGLWNTLRLDVTPVDFAAKAIVHLSLNAPPNCFHIANHQGFSLHMIVNAMKKKGIDLSTKASSTWLEKTIPTTSMAAAYMALCRLLPTQFERFRPMDLFQATNIEFEQTNTHRYLEHTGIICPPADEALLNKYMDWIYGL